MLVGEGRTESVRLRWKNRSGKKWGIADWEG